MATVTSLTKAEIESMVAGLESIGASQEEINASLASLITDLAAANLILEDLTSTTMPALNAAVAANNIAVDNVTDTLLPAMQLELDSHDAALDVLNDVTLPALDTQMNSNSDNVNELMTVTLPAMQTDLDANTAALDTLNTVTLPALDTAVDANTSALSTLNTVTLPDLDTRLDAVEGSTGFDPTDLEAALAALEAKFPIGTTDIQDDAITADKILAHTITALEILADTITANEIAADTITANEIAAHTITAAEIFADTITANEIATDTITANEIAANAITTTELNANAVTAAKIAADTITANEIAANAITTTELAANAVTAAKIAADTITAAQIAADAVTASEIAANTITAAEIAANTITANEIAADAVTASEIAADAVTASEIAANTITAAEIAAGTITATEIAAGTITANEMAADAITVDLLTANNVLADSLGATDISAVTFIGGTYKTSDLVEAVSGADAGVVFDRAGIRAYAAGGIPFMNVDPASGLAIVVGTGQFNTLTLLGGGSLGGITEIARGLDGSAGKVVLTAGTTAPKNAPTVIPVWRQNQLATPTTNAPAWSTFRGFAKVTIDSGHATAGIPANTYYISLAQSVEFMNQMEVHFWKVSDRTWQGKIFINAVTTLNRYLGAPHGLTVNPHNNDIYALFKATDDKFQIWRGSANGPIGLYQYNGADESSTRIHGLGWDQDPATQTIPLLILAFSKTTGLLSGHRTDTTGGNETVLTTNLAEFAEGSKACCGVLYGLPTGASPAAGFDTNVNRALVTSTRGSEDFWLTSYTGTHLSSYDWPPGMTSKTGILWDGTNFQGLDQSGKIWTYTDTWSSTAADMYKWASYTLANSTYETTESPRKLLLMPKRSSLQVTIGSINSGGGGTTVPDRGIIYVGQGAAGDPGRTAMDKQPGQPLPGVTQVIYDSELITSGAGTDPPSTNGFVTAGATTQRLEATNNGPFYVDGNSDGSLGTGTFKDAVVTAANPAGTVQQFAGTSLPTGWLYCDGQSLLRASYPALAAALGNPVGGGSTGPWGAADSTHFNLPDLRSRVPIGVGTLYPLGAGDAVAAGSRTLTHVHGNGTLANNAVGDHSHGAGSLATGNPDQFGDRGTGGTSTPSTVHHHGVSGSTADNGGHNHSISGSTGSGGADVIPYAALYHIIKT